ncbi:hypothetical protein SAMN03159485_03680 [Pseudomonas sp. NFPP24]|nr:hypothetical protein SAMN03159485_03680 [Pseudomonas sp. NFPP24]
MTKSGRLTVRFTILFAISIKYITALCGAPSGSPSTFDAATIVPCELTVLPVSPDLSPTDHPLICAHVERNAQPT